MNLVINNRQGRRFRGNLYSLAAMCALLPLLFLTACSSNAEERAASVGGVTARQVIENPAAYVGKTVTVSGDIEEIWGPRAFNMDSGMTGGELLVVGREPFPNVADRGNTGFLVNDVATVTGVVRMLVAADIEREIGWDLDPQIETEFNAKPVLIAQTIAFRAGPGPGTTNPMANQTMTNTNMPASQGMTNSNMNASDSGEWLTDTGIWASTEDKLSLVGRNVKFTDARVVRVVGPQTFTIASGSGEIYVMLDEESARGVGTQGKISDGETVNLTGEFVRMDPAAISDLANARFRPLTDVERTFLKKTAVFLLVSDISGIE